MTCVENGDTYEFFRQFIYEQSGIHLGSKKQVLVRSRIRKRMNDLNIATAEEYIECIQNDTTGIETIYLLDSMTTNHTFFFREARHFEKMADEIESRIKLGQRKFRIWCAASSTGEEPYAIAMTLKNLFRRLEVQNIDCKILATDLSTRVLKTAAKGRYKDSQIKSLPFLMRDLYFHDRTINGEQYWDVRPDVKEMVKFARFNLITKRYPMNGPFDAIFIRNVMIYFDEKTRGEITRKLQKLLTPEGLVFVGMTESLMGIKSRLNYIEPAVYGFDQVAAPSSRITGSKRNPLVTS